MWGSSLADLAKKAQELQEQASHISTGEFFNLDAMQAQPNDGSGDKKKAGVVSGQVDLNTSVSQPAFSMMANSPVVIQSQAPKAPKGVLKIPARIKPGFPEQKPSSYVLNKSGNSIGAEGKCEAQDPVQGVGLSRDEKITGPSIVSEEPDPGPAPSPAPPSNISLGEEQATASTNPLENEIAEVTPTVETQLSNTENVNAESSDVEASERNNELGGCQESSSAHHPEELPHTPTAIVNNLSEAKEISEESLPSIVHVHTSPSTHEAPTNNVHVDQGSNGGPHRDSIDSPISANSGDHRDQEEPVYVETIVEASASAETTPPAESTRNALSEPPSKLHEVHHQMPGATSELLQEHFTQQLQRLEANFEAERTQIEQAAQLKEQELLSRFQSEMTAKDNKLRELMRIKEGNELRMDSLKREVEGVKQLLTQRDNDIANAQAGHNQAMAKLEQNLKVLEAGRAKAESEVKELKAELSTSRGEVGARDEEYTALKSRVKVVAGELKERRVECRELTNKIAELSQGNDELLEHIADLRSQLSDRDRSRTEKDEEAVSLSSTIEQLQKELKLAEQAIVEKEAENEKLVATYKKKAQSSLAVANARAAAAVQAKEEAELEARAARSTADSAMARAREAALAGEEAMARAKAYYKEMEMEKSTAVEQLGAARKELDQVHQDSEQLIEQLGISQTEGAKFLSEKNNLLRELDTERRNFKTAQADLKKSTMHAEQLQKKVKELQNQLESIESAPAAGQQSKESEQNGGSTLAPTLGNSHSVADSNSKATLLMLQKEVAQANETIDELKEALRNAVDSSSAGKARSGPTADHNDGARTESAPLFYAIEKQAELNTARNEINRLASLYADVQSEKVEAEEALEEMRRQMEEARAKLERFEKLSPAAVGNQETDNGAGSRENEKGGTSSKSNESGRMNIEYLKNVMLSYLNAKTLAEKKALVPVIGAVLCLTPDEQTKAIQNVEACGGIEGVSSALFESIGTRVHRII